MTYNHEGMEKIVQEAEAEELLNKINRGWTTEELLELRRLYAIGKPYKEIAKVLGKTVRSIEKKIYYLAITTNRHRSYSSEEIRQVVRLYFRGNSPRQIGRILNRTQDSVRSEIRRLELSK